VPVDIERSLENLRSQNKPLVVREDFAKEEGLGPARDAGPESLYVPMSAKGGTLGALRICLNYPHRLEASDIELLALLGNTAAIAIENSRLFKEKEQRLNRLAALRAMDMAIGSSFDLRVTLNVLLEQITSQLNVDAASVLLYNEYTQSLEFAAGRGFRTNTLTRTRLRLDEDLPGKAALERRLIAAGDQAQFSLSTPRLAGESFVSYYGVPLLAKGDLKGVLEIFHRSALKPDLEWLDFLETLAGDTAIAIDNTTLFNDLQRTNIELTLAYDTTLEGWSRILELRALEPPGHSHRIMEMAISLAVAMGVSETELVHFRRGVLLHDIGIIGVPESISQKPGPLTPDEWSVMRMHPIYAYDVLLPITYLRPALDIPYCHHEKWDGTGYPRGLKGHQVPLAARIFAAVDVWDALQSDRPYRQAWTHGKVIEYLRSQSGIHFDPQVINVFFRLLSGS
jgi:HD-GYP domain-containing protein (c-di-GMP phosphodiesterase class II)